MRDYLAKLLPELSVDVAHDEIPVSEIEGKAAIFDIPVGKGRTIAFDFDPIHRYQTESDFRLVWNVILNWNDLPAVPPGPR